MSNSIRYFIKNHLNYILILLWMIIVLTAVLHHELWFDEALAFRFVKEHSLYQLLFLIGNSEEIHPPMWYLLIYPFAHLLNAKNISIQGISFIFMLLSVCYFCFKCPFNFFTKILFIFSTGMTYLFPVIARNYSLIPIFMFILADLYPKRHSKPILYALVIVMLSQTHALIWGFCLICALLFIFEILQIYFNKSETKNFKTISSYLISTFILVSDGFYLFTLFKRQIFNYMSRFNINDIQEKIQTAISLVPQNLDLSLGIDFNLFIAGFVILLLLIFLINKKSSFILLASVFCFEFVYIFLENVRVAGIPSQKVFIIILFIVFSCWILEKKNKVLWVLKDIVLFIFFAFLFFKPPFYKVIGDEIQNYFSNQPIIMNYLESNLKNDDKVLIISLVTEPSFLIGLEDNISRIDDNDEIVDNNFISEYIKKTGDNIKYIILPDETKQNLKIPYKKVFSSPKNKVNSITICDPYHNNYSIYQYMDYSKPN